MRREGDEGREMPKKVNDNGKELTTAGTELTMGCTMQKTIDRLQGSS